METIGITVRREIEWLICLFLSVAQSVQLILLFRLYPDSRDRGCQDGGLGPGPATAQPKGNGMFDLIWSAGNGRPRARSGQVRSGHVIGLVPGILLCLAEGSNWAGCDLPVDVIGSAETQPRKERGKSKWNGNGDGDGTGVLPARSRAVSTAVEYTQWNHLLMSYFLAGLD